MVLVSINLSEFSVSSLLLGLVYFSVLPMCLPRRNPFFVPRELLSDNA